MEAALQQVVYKTEKGTPVTDSVKVAEVFGKMHKNVLKSIRNILGSAQNLAHKTWFHQVTYIDAQGKTQPMFLMNRDGFSLLAMSLTGERRLAIQGRLHSAIRHDGTSLERDSPGGSGNPGDSSNIRPSVAPCRRTSRNHRSPTKAACRTSPESEFRQSP